MIDYKDYFEALPTTVEGIVNPNAVDPFFMEYSKNTALNAVLKQGLVTGITSDGTTGQLTLKSGEEIPFDYAILTTGAKYGCVSLRSYPSTTKAERIAVFQQQKDAISDAEGIVVVGGGTVGVQVASFIAEAFPEKSVTLIASGSRVLERFSEEASEYAANWLTEHKVKVVCNERVTEWGGVEDTPIITAVKTDKGNAFTGLVFKCVGITPNTGDFGSALKLNSKGAIEVNSKLQVEGIPNVFAAGDVASTEEEKTADYAYYGGVAAATNVAALIEGKEMGDFPESIFGCKKIPFQSGATLGTKDALFEMYLGLQKGPQVAASRPAVCKMLLKATAGSWFWSWLVGWMKTKGASRAGAAAVKNGE